MSTPNHQRKRKERKEQNRTEESIIDNTVQMNLFICLMHMRDSSTDAINEKEMETEH